MSNLEVAVITAMNPRLNTGMITVDVAALDLLEDLNIKPVLYTFAPPTHSCYLEKLNDNSAKLIYCDLVKNFERLLRSKTIILWGDFLFSRQYFELDLAPNLIKEGVCVSRDDAYETIYRHLFFVDQEKDFLKRINIIGGTTICDTAEDSADLIYRKNLSRLLSLSNYVSVRDAFSFARLKPQFPKVRLGLDNAFLGTRTRRRKYSKTENDHSPKTKTGLFFSRSPNLRGMIKYSRAVADAISSEPVWIPWFPIRSPLQRSLIQFNKIRVPKTRLHTNSILDVLDGCDQVITDTYHLAVNAWHRGIPAICIGLGAELRQGTLADKKKEVLFRTLSADSYYVFCEELNSRSSFRTAVERSVASLSNRCAIEGVLEQLAKSREATREIHLQTLTSAIDCE